MSTTRSGFTIGEAAEIRTAQHYPQTVFRFDPFYIKSLSPGERELYAYLNVRAWQKKNLIIRTAVPFLVSNIGISAAAIKRHFKTLFALRLATCVHVNHKKGNSYLIEPLLLAKFCWKTLPLRHLEQSRFFQSVQKGPLILEEIAIKIHKSAQNEPLVGSKWTDYLKLLGTESAHNEPQIYLLYSLLLRDLDNAMSQRSPSDRSHKTSREKQIALARANVEKEKREQLVEGENLQVTC